MIINCLDANNLIIENKNLNLLLNEVFFFDIETTGLSHKCCDIISITILIPEIHNIKIYQLFCEYKHDEKEMLEYFKTLIKDKKYVITYNGNTFDIPFITSKSRQYDINFNLDNFIKIDLYNDIRHNKNKLLINDLKLKTVEDYFNLKRDDTISGQDVIILYEAYKIEPRKEFSSLILQHNYYDVYNLPLLFESIINLYDEIIYYNNLIIKINYSDFKFKKNVLIGNFNIISDLKTDFIIPSINYDLKTDLGTQNIEIKIPVQFFKNNDIKEFYFINNDDMNITKYTAIKGIKKNLIPLKFNNEVCYNNIIIIIRKILDSIFMK